MTTLLARLESVRERVAGGKWRETYLSVFDETSDATAVACVRALRRQLYTERAL